MAARLRSITKRIPSSLLLKSGTLTVLWLFGKAAWPLGFTSPLLIFFVAAFYFYMVPLFRPGSLGVPFAMFLGLALLLPGGILSALALGAIFALLLGIKDLLFVDRETAYEILVFAVLFLTALIFYSTGTSAPVGIALLAPVFPGLIYFLLVRVMPWRDPPRTLHHPTASLLGAFLAGEAALVLALLPLDYLYQAGMLFMLMVLLIFLDVRHKEGTLTSRVVLSAFLPFALAAGLILILNNWRI